MQIILVHPALQQARTIDIGARSIVLVVLLLVATIAAGSGLLSYLTMRYLPALAPMPVVTRVVDEVSAQAARYSGLETPATPSTDAADPANHGAARRNLDALAIRLGQLQAQLLRLDAIGERVAAMAGVKPAELPKAVPGRGGPATGLQQVLSVDELATAADQVAHGLDTRADLFHLIESELLYRTVTTKLLPSSQPLSDAFVGSRFGRRIDPFNGRVSVHEGIDFNAPTGTPILAAGGGVVVYAGVHAGYGNMIDLDHGDGTVTRYAHASRLLVREGDVVRQGQRIAEVGSTGRSTGPHLHFEVRVDGEAQDPMQFLRRGFAAREARPLARR